MSSSGGFISISGPDCPESFLAALSSLRCARCCSFILLFSTRFISFWRFRKVVVKAAPRQKLYGATKSAPSSRTRIRRPVQQHQLQERNWALRTTAYSGCHRRTSVVPVSHSQCRAPQNSARPHEKNRPHEKITSAVHAAD